MDAVCLTGALSVEVAASVLHSRAAQEAATDMQRCLGLLVDLTTARQRALVSDWDVQLKQAYVVNVAASPLKVFPVRLRSLVEDVELSVRAAPAHLSTTPPVVVSGAIYLVRAVAAVVSDAGLTHGSSVRSDATMSGDEVVLRPFRPLLPIVEKKEEKVMEICPVGRPPPVLEQLAEHEKVDVMTFLVSDNRKREEVPRRQSRRMSVSSVSSGGSRSVSAREARSERARRTLRWLVT